ncbi:MAG: enoyl-CoA hydratase/isomerase family protein [Syntrophomonadaceae bacterium]|nr:enoyl-CoA hydratase/isomerase family protein [Syntrophomonadaceae bacterium]
MNFETISFQQTDKIGIIKINRPEAKNALNEQLFRELNQLLDSIKENDNIRVLILTGGEKVFAAGADIKHMASLYPMEAEEFITLINSASDKIAGLNKPTIAAIAGYCLGGGLELALACDILIASQGSKMGQPEINVGIIPGGGGTQRLIRLIGSGWGKRLIMTGEIIDANHALQLGLITEITEPDLLMSRAKELAVNLQNKSSVALRAAKRCIEHGQNVELASGLEFEQKMWALLFSTNDQKEGMEAFIQKRRPQFIGK